ncbi:MAG: hypothetical protein LBM71_03560 [Elusimicrobiota bacterium]|jgi:hypothetical protein|nr:hypothetical protein [Elusimicrobiota bacterium]
MQETIYEKTLREFKDRLLRNELDKLDETRIANFIARYPNKRWTRQQVIADCLSNEKFCAKMAKDAMKQNLEEASIINKIGAKKLPAGGKKNIRFDISSGNLVVGKKADNINKKYTKSADFIMEYKGQTIYGTQKSIHGSGGHQDSQLRDAVEFVQAGNIKYKAIAVVDGAKLKSKAIGVYTSQEVLKKKRNKEYLI